MGRKPASHHGRVGATSNGTSQAAPIAAGHGVLQPRSSQSDPNSVGPDVDPIRPTEPPALQSTIALAVAAARMAGLPIAAIEITRDGTVRLPIARPTESADEFTQWENRL
jgi:hypothetical protein